VAARVFVQYLKSRPDDSQTVDSLRFLLAAMGALKRRNPLTESFLVQLDVDLEALGARIPKLRAAFPRNTLGVSLACNPLLSYAKLTGACHCSKKEATRGRAQHRQAQNATKELIITEYLRRVTVIS
jgi:hypothetical protein